jgi:chromosome segregation ATPase
MGSKAIHTTAKQYAAAMQKNPTLIPPAPLPAPSITDRLSGRWAEKSAEHKREQAEYVALAEKARNEALIGRQNRQRQAAAVQKMRAELEEAKRHEVEAAQLREENARLERELKNQRTYFERQIDDLKTQLARAVDQVKDLLVKVGTLTRQRDRAEAAEEELRAIIYPGERQSSPAPGSH